MQLASKTGGGLTSLPANEADAFGAYRRGNQNLARRTAGKVSRAMCSCWKIARQAPWRGFVPLRWRLG
ncbi:hypothetical protein ACLK1S_10970 [Escherichia coli]